MIAALFDVEGTLYTAQMGRGLRKYAAAHGRRRAAQVYVAALAPRYYLRKLKLIAQENLTRPAIERLAPLIKGWTLEEGAAAFEWVALEFILPTGRADVIARCQEHRAQGHAVVLVSGILMPCLELIGAHLGAVGVAGTGLEVSDGRYTGRIVPPVIIGIEKDYQTRKFFAMRGLEIDWSASYAYADSLHDRALLELVGRPVAVYPDPDLRELARARNWEMIGAG